MPIFSYKVKDSRGRDLDGAVEAADSSQATEVLKERGYQVVSVTQREETSIGNLRFTFLQRVKTEDIVVFSRQLSVMVGASISIVRSLRTAARQTTSPKLQKVVLDIASEVEGGVRLSDAFAKYPHVFGTFYVNMLRSGETSGKLDEVLHYLADQQEKDLDLRRRVKGAMTYPIFVLIMLFIVGTVMMVFVVPKLTAVLRESGADLPITTKGLIAISDFFVRFWYLIIGGVLGITFGTRAAYRTPAGKRFIDRFLLHIPVFGPLFRKIYITRITHSLSTLIEGGVDMVTSLKVVAGVVGNEVYREALVQTVQEVSAGNTMASVWKTRKEIPDMVTQMVAIGEETGKLQQVLGRLTDFYTREVNASVATLSTAIEPIIMLVMGVAVGALVSAIILPMYNLAQQM
ncbi:MAG TPA: type II secretion system F family protein [Candidatus Baltobacteraceae bacterium]|nr:type II secretion system F family protein [Candidatus Baltobacteraceae bacterium]